MEVVPFSTTQLFNKSTQLISDPWLSVFRLLEIWLYLTFTQQNRCHNGEKMQLIFLYNFVYILDTYVLRCFDVFLVISLVLHLVPNFRDSM